MTAQVYRSGTLAYLDTFAGLVPCKVLAVEDTWSLAHEGTRRMCKVQLTADRGAYRRGEVLYNDPSRTIPRDRVRHRKHGSRILDGFTWLP